LHHVGLEMRRLRRDGRNGSLEQRLSVDVIETDSAKRYSIRDGTREVVWVDSGAELHAVS
jgi:hypothetical protein